MDDVETIRERMRRENDKRDEEAIRQAKEEGFTDKEFDDLIESNARKRDRADEERLERVIKEMEEEVRQMHK
jgi:hypothetical protein